PAWTAPTVTASAARSLWSGEKKVGGNLGRFLRLRGERRSGTGDSPGPVLRSRAASPTVSWRDEALDGQTRPASPASRGPGDCRGASVPLILQVVPDQKEKRSCVRRPKSSGQESATTTARLSPCPGRN